MQPRQYSIVWIAWCKSSSPKLNCERNMIKSMTDGRLYSVYPAALLCSHSPSDDPHWTRGHCGCYPPPCHEPSAGRAPRHCRAAHVHTPDKIGKVSQVYEFSVFGDVSHICTHAFQVVPDTFAGAGFHYEANKGREVFPEITQALTEQQWPLEISAGHSGGCRALTKMFNSTCSI